MKFSAQASKAIRLSIFLCFFYQIYDLTNDYLKYDHLNKLDISPTNHGIPAITLCINKFNIKNNNFIHSSCELKASKFYHNCKYSPKTEPFN